MNFEQARFNMIEQQIRPWDVLDPGVLELLGMVRREDFVPAAWRNLAFVDMEIPLADGQVMLAPRLEARLLQTAAVRRHERVLEIGTGSGFMAALLGHQAREVTSVEVRPALAETARRNLARAGLHNVTVLEGNAATLDLGGPWDAIVLSGSLASVPQGLLDRLDAGGRLVGVFGDAPVMRAVRLSRVDGQWHREELFDTVIARLEGFAAPDGFRF